ncbi:MAG: response regulator transcription factor [Candidatus Omnitrophica bacterium]|nr:response regulator transcription factor [Candidatus Omnitrophota bacterium]
MPTVLLVDDEPLAREGLKRLIGSCHDIRVVGEAADGKEALQKIKELSPQIVFLDIRMPHMSGLEVAAQIQHSEKPPVIIFATAYDEYAVKAFELSAVDYILKPYEKERILKAVDRAKLLLGQTEVLKDQFQVLNRAVSKGGFLDRICGFQPESKERNFFDVASVMYFHAELADVYAHLKTGQTYLVKSTLKELLTRLNPKKFFQVHKAHIVNIDFIGKITPQTSGNFSIQLNIPEKTMIPLSRRFARPIRNALRW